MKTDNELIAEFMKRPYYPVKAGFEGGGSYLLIDKIFDSRDACLAYCDFLNDGKHPDQCFSPLPKDCGGFSDFTLKYDTDWNWLMDAADKFTSIQFQPNRSATYRRRISDFESNCESIQYHIGQIDIKEAFDALVRGIKWYNDQRK